MHNNASRIPIAESVRCRTEAVRPWAPTWQPDSPTLTLKGLLKVTSLSRSKAYELMKSDPGFPTGIPRYDGERSPKFWWTHEVIAYLEARSNKFRNESKENQL
jgi:predicted DNA-binding transcriptional regulator AlpA